jgi:parallel beta-helix repeat protein
VYLPAGRYPLRRSVELRDGVTVRGDGQATVVTRPRQVIVPVSRPSDGGREKLHVDGTRGLRVGDQIYVGDADSHGWWASHCVIRAIRGGVLAMEVRHGKSEHRFLPRRGAFAANWFPAFWLRDVRNATIEGLAIDGGVRRQRRERCDFVVAAIHSRGSENLRVLNVAVRNWLGDGIGIQGGRGALVHGCLVENCAGHGYHPGTGLAQSVWSDNIARGNTRDGFYFCLRVTYATVRGNVLVANAGNGIGDLSDPDQSNTVVGNVCAENGRHGIEATRSIGNVIQGNVCRNNSRGERGKFAGIYLSGHRQTCVTGNVCVDDQKRPTQLHPIVEEDPAGQNVVRDNLCSP